MFDYFAGYVQNQEKRIKYRHKNTHEEIKTLLHDKRTASREEKSFSLAKRRRRGKRGSVADKEGRRCRSVL